MRDSVIFYRSFYEAIKELPSDVQATVYSAIFEYSLNFNEVILEGLPKAIFTLIKPQLDANNKRYENGKKGGKPNQATTKTEPKPNQVETKPEPNENVNVNGNVNVNANDILLEKETKDNKPDSELFSTDKLPEAEERKKGAPKKERPEPPDLDTFIQYAKETYQNDLKRDFSPFAFAVQSKYESWMSAGWKDGNGKAISNWKTKLKNTIPHLKAIYKNGSANNTRINGRSSITPGTVTPEFT